MIIVWNEMDKFTRTFFAIFGVFALHCFRKVFLSALGVSSLSHNEITFSLRESICCTKVLWSSSNCKRNNLNVYQKSELRLELRLGCVLEKQQPLIRHYSFFKNISNVQPTQSECNEKTRSPNIVAPLFNASKISIKVS